MTQETAEKAKSILSEMCVLERITHKIENEYDMWWSFCTARSNKDEMMMPKTLRQEFKKAVIRAKENLQKELENL